MPSTCFWSRFAHPTTSRGRLIFGLDATASRKAGMGYGGQRSRAQMFREAAAIGNLDLQLVFYRGEANAKPQAGSPIPPARPHHVDDRLPGRQDPDREDSEPTSQKETALLHVGRLVFIGDALEENPDTLVTRARELGRSKTPAFLFQEGRDSEVEIRLSRHRSQHGGAYALSVRARRQLGELLKAVAVFTTGGLKALEGRKDAGSTLLLGNSRATPEHRRRPLASGPSRPDPALTKVQRRIEVVPLNHRPTRCTTPGPTPLCGEASSIRLAASAKNSVRRRWSSGSLRARSRSISSGARLSGMRASPWEGDLTRTIRPFRS